MNSLIANGLEDWTLAVDADFDESAVKRVSKGKEGGGQFTSKGGGEEKGEEAYFASGIGPGEEAEPGYEPPAKKLTPGQKAAATKAGKKVMAAAAAVHQKTEAAQPPQPVTASKHPNWAAMSPGQKAAWTKKQNQAANNKKIQEAAKATPAQQKQAEQALTAAEQKGHKPLWVKATVNGEPQIFKLQGVPSGLDSTASVQKLLGEQPDKWGELHPVSVQNVSLWNESKPLPPAFETVTAEQKAIDKLETEKYEEAKAAVLASGPITSSESLSDDIISSIKSYTDGSYLALNKALRTGQPLQSHQAVMAANLDKAIRNNKVLSERKVYRGLTDAEKFFGPTVKIGTIVIDNGFISVSKHRDTADNFAGYNGKVCVISLPKGSPALDIEAWSLLGDSEKEALLPRGSMFKVTNVSGKEVHLEYANY
jgi:hypothetical protein